MTSFYYLTTFMSIIVFNQANDDFHGQPEQIHLSYGGDPTRQWVTWSTGDNVEQYIEFGESTFDKSLRASTTKFVDGGSLHNVMYTHRVLLTDLIPGRTYIYHVGNNKYGWSAVYYFRALKPTGHGYRYAVFGDLGNVNPQSLGRITQETQRGHFDMILHVGDMAYNMMDNNGTRGDIFMRQIEPAAAYVPYMVIPGNHENAYNFSNYASKFSMPDWDKFGNHFYSFDLGQAHILAFSSEFLYYTGYGLEQIENQYRFMVDDLKKAHANRHNVPWIITMAHRPMYCSDWDSDDCTRYASRVRSGFTDEKGNRHEGFEDLFYKYGVDLELWAHEHSFERMWPVYNRTVYNGTTFPYVDPVAPVHIVTGSAGCQELTDPFIPKLPPWSAYHNSNYGYSRMQVHNSTHLYFEQVSDDLNGKVIDHLWLVKHEHIPYEKMKRNPKHAEKFRRAITIEEDFRMPGDYEFEHRGHLL